MAEPRTVTAAVSHTFGRPLALQEVVVASPGPGEVRVDLGAVAICHSDVSYADGAWGGELPAVWGHEAAGVIESVGEGVTDVAVGARVVVTLIRSCGSCHACLAGLEVACTTEFALDHRSPLADAEGRTIHHGLRTGAFAETTVVHASQVVALPDDISMDQAALLACGVITGAGAALNTASIERGSTVVVIGAGGVGANVVQGARLGGAAEIIAVDLEATKLEMAVGLGATVGIDPGTDEVRQVVAERTAGRMADYVFVAAGSRAAFDAAVPLVGVTGALVIVGMPPSGVTVEIDPSDLAAGSRRILGSKMGSARIRRDIPWLIDRHRCGELQLDSLISGRYPFELINTALDDARTGLSLRNVVMFDR